MLSVYDGRIAIYGTLVVPKTISGNLKTDDVQLRIRYQACNDVKCLPPKTIKLQGKLPLAAPGETVRQINRKLFAKPKAKPKN